MSRVFLQEEVNFEFAIVNAISSHRASIIFLNHAMNAFFALKVKHESQIRSYVYNEDNLITSVTLAESLHSASINFLHHAINAFSL